MIRTVLKEIIASNSMLPFAIRDEVVKQTMHIQELFPTPIIITHIDKALNQKTLAFIKSKEIKYVRNRGGNSISSDLYTLESDELNDIKKVLTDSVNEYFKKIIIPDEEVELYITNSWINVNKNGEAHHLHKHTNSMVSGVLYIDTCEGDTISFSNENSEVFGNLKFNDIPKTKWTVHEWDIPAINNRLIIFPSSLLHFVKPRPNTCTGSRISLSFNTWIKGDTWVAESRSQ
tara:strand:+ start:23 stop:718 length:696 start_codon:yes stop_codon:yes gene_type:complete